MQTTIGIGKPMHEKNPYPFACVSQALRGADQGMNLFCLHPGVMMGQQAGKQKVAWQILFSAISGGELRLPTE
jgi:hypothetical protein